ncbi:TonB-dependent receptor [Alistipes sp. ZOR0009]|uniref:TonB-dependent receptor n=1 Tax=Alistipes sp. ZOR0009 TaxID=1339253 RepID=UPI00068977F9|nr:TonB-dependent receptor [Alistipes sp. ZOR0009]
MHQHKRGKGAQVLLVPFILLLFLFGGIKTRAQQRVTQHFAQVTLTQALKSISKKYNVQIAYNPSLTDKVKVNVNIENKNVEEALQQLTQKTGFKIIRVEAHSFILEEVKAPVRPPTPTKKKKYTISGYLSQDGSSEKLIAATVAVKGQPIGTSTNEFGFYSITLEEGSYELAFTFVGYRPQVKQIDLKENLSLNVSLSPGQLLEEVVVKGNKELDFHFKPQMSANTISMDYVKSTPILFGEADVLKTLQLLPGVKTGNEGSAGMYIRGGSPDQNLILLDGVPIYNAAHLLGFFSIFNADAINSTQLLKGGFPARFGERLSSVVDIRMKDGNMEKYEGEVALGFISSKLSINGPIVKNRTSFIVSARRTYADLLFKALSSDKSGYNEIPSVYFYDINAKINHKFSDNDRLYLSLYKGRDVMSYKYEDNFSINEVSSIEKLNFGINWGNGIAALRWNHIFSPKLFANTTTTFTRYNFRIKNSYTQKSDEPDNNQDITSRFLSGIDDIGAKIDFDYLPSTKHTMKFGVSAIYHIFSPSVSEQIITEQGTEDKEVENKHIYAKELAAYYEDQIRLTSRLTGNFGLRTSLFNVDSHTYCSIEPRLSLSWLTSNRSSIKFSYAEMSQYLHFLTSGSLSLPSDLWVPTTKKVKPQHSRQVALGYTYNLGDVLFSLETYYKRMNRIIEYKDGSIFNTSDVNWEDKVTSGKGDCYGAEFLIEKKVGKLTGWIGYTLSWSDRTFNELNFGKKFPYSYDRRHDVSITCNYQFSPKIDVGATWVYSTGRAYTLGTDNYPAYEGDVSGTGSKNQVSYISNRNNVRLPSYHRLDFGVNFRKKKRWYERTWTLGVYNVYNRLNTFYVYPNYDKGTFTTVGLFTLIPSVSYSLKF